MTTHWFTKMRSAVKGSAMTVSVDVEGNRFGADLTAFNILLGRYKTGFDLRFGSQRHVGKWVPLLGAHQLYPILMAVAVGLCFEIPLHDSLKQLTELNPLSGRMRPLEGVNGSLIVDDTNTGDLESTLRALDWLKAIDKDKSEKQGRSYFVIGDIAGLGNHSLKGHRDIGRHAAPIVDQLITKGEMAVEVGRGAEDNDLASKNVHMTFSASDAVYAVKHRLAENDIVLVKGSASARMERVVRELLANPETDQKLLPRHESAFDSVWMDRPARPTWLHIDMDAVASNVRQIKSLTDDVALMAVVKANAYGHGAVAVSTTALLNGATYLGVASINEAIELRDAGITAPILILGYTPAWAAGLAIRYDVAVTLYDTGLARAFDRAAREMNATVKAHIKVDTGMGRLGILPDDATLFFRSLAKLNAIEIEGIFTHFSIADDDATYTGRQIEQFNTVVNLLKAAGYQFKYIHAANSAAILNHKDSHFTMVRAGIAMHGLHPSSDCKLPDVFKPALSWKTTIAQVKRLPNNSVVGYGNTYRTRGTEKIAVIPVGYADGFRRAPDTWAHVLVNGTKARIVGRVSMDQTMIDVNHLDDVKVGDEVVLIGQQGDREITAEQVAEWLNTVNYEVVSTILARVPRVK